MLEKKIMCRFFYLLGLLNIQGSSAVYVNCSILYINLWIYYNISYIHKKICYAIDIISTNFRYGLKIDIIYLYVYP